MNFWLSVLFAVLLALFLGSLLLVPEFPRGVGPGVVRAWRWAFGDPEPPRPGKRP